MTPVVPKPAGWIDLSCRAIFRLTGPDRTRYLNGQVTNNVAALRTGQSMPALVCSAKGRLQGEVVITARADDYLVDAPGELRESLLARLEKYLIADDCAWEDVTEQWHLWHGLGLESADGPATRRFGPPGLDHWLPRGSPKPPGPHLSPEEVDLIRIKYRVPAWGAELTEERLPQEARLEDTAVDFHKGCYVGQEVVSRLRSVGQVRRLLCRLESLDDSPLHPGDHLFVSASEAGAEPTEIGVVTSARRDPAVQRSLALGFLPRPHAAFGTVLMAGPDKNRLSTTLKCAEIDTAPVR